jgi:hypothetical protein
MQRLYHHLLVLLREEQQAGMAVLLQCGMLPVEGDVDTGQMLAVKVAVGSGHSLLLVT